MTEPEDPFDTWLHTQVEPLRPPPGTFERIRKQATRRKRRRALVSAVSAGGVAVVIVAAIVAVPRLVPSLHSSPQPAARSSASRPSFGPSHPATTPPASVTPPTSTSSASSNQPATVPADLAPTSVTFINYFDGWVIGQAPGCGHPYCTTVAKTNNYGQSWKPIPAPPAGAPDGGTGVSQIRFLDPSNGWAFGPQLYETHDGGQSWTPIDTHGMRVTGLETIGGVAYAVFAKCTGTGTDFAANCKRVSVWSAPFGSDQWTPVQPLTGFGFNNGDVSGQIVLAHGVNGSGSYDEGYFYAPDGLLYAGSATQGASWQLTVDKPMPCTPSSAQPDGQPSGGQLAASTAGSLFLACPGTYGSSQETIYASTDSGQNWRTQGTLTVQGSATSLAASISGGTLTLATTGGIYQSSDGGQNWKLAEQGPPGGFSYVGMTSPLKGVAVPAQPAQSNSVWYTTDGGTRWTQSSLTNP